MGNVEGLCERGSAVWCEAERAAPWVGVGWPMPCRACGSGTPARLVPAAHRGGACYQGSEGSVPCKPAGAPSPAHPLTLMLSARRARRRSMSYTRPGVPTTTWTPPCKGGGGPRAQQARHQRTVIGAAAQQAARRSRCPQHCGPAHRAKHAQLRCGPPSLAGPRGLAGLRSPAEGSGCKASGLQDGLARTCRMRVSSRTEVPPTQA